jgi:hypothetical protein
MAEPKKDARNGVIDAMLGVTSTIVTAADTAISNVVIAGATSRAYHAKWFEGLLAPS